MTTRNASRLLARVYAACGPHPVALGQVAAVVDAARTKQDGTPPPIRAAMNKARRWIATGSLIRTGHVDGTTIVKLAPDVIDAIEAGRISA